MNTNIAVPQGGGGGGGKRKNRRKRGGGGPPAGGGGNKGGSRRPRGGPGRGGSESSSRFKPNAPSPLQLPHVKVTIRNISDGTKHDTIEGIVDSIRFFLKGAFPSAQAAALVSSSNGGVGGDNGSVSKDAYLTAWQLEREEFDGAKSMFVETAGGATAAPTTTTASPSSSAPPSSPASRAFSSGWVYEEKPLSLPADRNTLLPSVESIVTDLMENSTDKRVTQSTNVNWIVDTAMSQIMQECGKSYLNYVGGRVVFDEESAVDAALAERVQDEKKKLAEDEEKKDESNAEEGGEDVSATENAADEKKDGSPSVEAVTKGIEKLTTSDKPAPSQQQPASVLDQSPAAIRIRILSVTPVKKSKRRGEIAGKVQLALYPPDPCLLFKDACRDAGKMAAERQVEKVNAAAVASESAASEGGEKNDMEAIDKDVDSEKDNVASSESKDDGAKTDETTDAKESKPSPPITATVPQIPYYPLLSPAERSRAVARSRVLLSRTIEAMKLHAAASRDHNKDGQSSWEVAESPSQKTWRGRPHPMVGSVLAGANLTELVLEHESQKADIAGANKKGKRFDSRGDRYDSTIENTEDYKSFIESLKEGSAPAKESLAAKNKSEKKVEQQPPAVDEEGRPLSAIVQHIRAKQEVERKAKAKDAAAVAKARAAAASAKDKVRKEKAKAKKESSRRRKKEKARSKKSASSARPSGGGGGGGSGKSMPPSGPSVLLKKSGGVKSSAIPPSGFG